MQEKLIIKVRQEENASISKVVKINIEAYNKAVEVANKTNEPIGVIVSKMIEFAFDNLEIQ